MQEWIAIVCRIIIDSYADTVGSAGKGGGGEGGGGHSFKAGLNLSVTEYIYNHRLVCCTLRNIKSFANLT